MIIKILKKGDKVINVTENLIVIQRRNGTVDILNFNNLIEKNRITDEDFIRIDYGNNELVQVKENIEIKTF